MKKLVQTILFIVIMASFILGCLSSNVKAYTREEYTQKLNESVAYAMSFLDDKMTDHEKAAVLYEYVQQGNAYRFGDRDQLAEGVLVDHGAVCAGYANAYRLLSVTAGLPTEYVRSIKQAHAWNISLLDGVWSYTDSTKGLGPYHLCGTTKLFYSQAQFDMIKVDGTWWQGDMAPGEGESMYFDDAYIFNRDSDLSYPETDGSYRSKLSYRSRVYYDENYKYYIDNDEDNFYDSHIYKEERSTGKKIVIVRPLYSFGGYESGMVKDEDYLYYVGEDFCLYSVKTDGTDNKKVVDISDTGRKIAGVYEQDGYIYYTTSETESSRDWEYIKYQKLQNYLTTGQYTLNTDEQKYVLNYIKTSKGITISSCEGLNGNEPEGKLYIPDTIDGMPVIGIGIDAFKNANLDGVLTLPKDLEYISEDSFKGTNIEGIVFNDKLKTIGVNAFSECDNIVGSLDFPDSLAIIDTYAFDDCTQISEINFGSGLKRIGNGAFYGNKKVEVLELPEGFADLDNEAFSWMSGLKSVILPESLKIYTDNAFWQCNKLTDIWIKSENMDEILVKGDFNLYLPEGTQTSKYADENNIEYIPDSELDINKAQISINNLATGEENISSLEIKSGHIIDLQLDISPSFWSNMPITWETSNYSVADVTEDGGVIGKREGEAVITATIGGRKVSVNVKVEKKYLLGDLDRNGKVTATDGFLAYDIFVQETDVTSEDLEIGDVDKNGKITATDAFIIYDAFVNEITL